MSEEQHLSRAEVISKSRELVEKSGNRAGALKGWATRRKGAHITSRMGRMGPIGLNGVGALGGEELLDFHYDHVILIPKETRESYISQFCMVLLYKWTQQNQRKVTYESNSLTV